MTCKQKNWNVKVTFQKLKTWYMNFKVFKQKDKAEESSFKKTEKKPPQRCIIRMSEHDF